MLVCVSLGRAGSMTTGTLPWQSCPPVTVPGLQGAAALPALGHPTLSLGALGLPRGHVELGGLLPLAWLVEAASWGARCLPSWGRVFPLPQPSASPGYFCRQQGQEAAPRPREDAVSAPARHEALCSSS